MEKIILVVLLAASTAFAQGVEHIKANYTKYEVEIQVRDGKKLFTSIYVPKDESEKTAAGVPAPLGRRHEL